jgi:DNA-binding beta-propeller fold protein YncE
MKRLLRLGFAALALVVFGRATCGPQKVAGVTPVQKMEFTDHVYYHNMGITWDGEYYYTVNGGKAANSVINEYDDAGDLVESYNIGTDGRAILYSPSEEQLYVKSYSMSLDEVDLDAEETSTDLEDIFSAEQSSVAMSPDGEKLYELYEGTVKVFSTDDGEEERTFALSSYNTTGELGYANAIAASGKFLFVWAPDSDKEILVYGVDGKYITKFELPHSGYGFSLSWANDMLWIAEDADGDSDGADGTWYGYALKGLE